MLRIAKAFLVCRRLYAPTQRHCPCTPFLGLPLPERAVSIFVLFLSQASPDLLQLIAAVDG